MKFISETDKEGVLEKISKYAASAIKKGAGIAAAGTAFFLADYLTDMLNTGANLMPTTYAQDSRIPPPPTSNKPKPNPNPAVPDKPKPTVPDTKPTTPKPNPQPTAPKPVVPNPKPATPAGQQRIVQSQPTEPLLAEMGAGINSNKSTKGTIYHISLEHDSLQARAVYDFEEWKNMASDDIVDRTISASLQMKPLEVLRLFNALGAGISQKVVDFIKIGGAYEDIRHKEKQFEHNIELDSQFKTTTDTSTVMTIDSKLIAGNIQINVAGLKVNVAAWQKTKKTGVDVNQTAYIENLADPSGNQTVSLSQLLETQLREMGLQGEIAYELKTSIKTETSEIPVRAVVSLFADYSKLEEELINMPDQETTKLLAGIGAKGEFADCLAYVAKAMAGLYDGPGTDQDGWKTPSGFAAVIIKADGNDVKNEQGDILYKVKTALTVMGWYKNNDEWGAGIGGVIGSGNIKLQNLEDFAEQEGMRRLRIYRTAGEALQARELERAMRMMPLACEKGVNFSVYGFVYPAKDKNNENAIGGEIYGALGAGPAVMMFVYVKEPNRETIGAYAGANLDPIRLLLGVRNETNTVKKEDSITGEVIAQFPLG